jgi:hypothetical protein
MTAMSAAPTLDDSWNRQLPDNTQDFAPQHMARGKQFSPPSLATIDLPRGKVLLIVDDATVALDLQRLLHEASYRVIGPATNLVEVQRMVERGDVDCAILDRDVDRRAPLCLSLMCSPSPMCLLSI